MHTATAKFVL